MNFNWDALDIGNVELEHSQNYFDIRHIEHERLNEQSEEFIDKIVPRSKPIAIFNGKRLFKSNEFEAGSHPEKKELKAPAVKQIKTEAQPHKPTKSNPKPPPARVTKKASVPTKVPVRPPTVARPSRLTQYAEAYAEKRKAMLDRYKKEQEEKHKPKRFCARSLPKYLKAKKAQRGSTTEENKENVSGQSKEAKLPTYRRNLRKSRSALEFK